jgi:hypothetical protein
VKNSPRNIKNKTILEICGTTLTRQQVGAEAICYFCEASKQAARVWRPPKLRDTLLLLFLFSVSASILF